MLAKVLPMPQVAIVSVGKSTQSDFHFISKLFFKCPISNSKLQTPNSKLQTPDFRFQISDFRFRSENVSGGADGSRAYAAKMRLRHRQASVSHAPPKRMLQPPPRSPPLLHSRRLS